jgi:pilus assembly protein CpaE
MTDIVAATASVELEHRLAAAASGAMAVLPPGPLPTDLGQLLQQLGNPTVPAVVVLDCLLGQTEALALSDRLSREPGGPRVVLVSGQGADLGLAALRAGVFDIVHPDADAAELAVVLGQAAAASAPRDPSSAAPVTGHPSHGRVISVVSSKGGVGKTTVSTNIAVGLAQHAPQSTVLVDLDVQFGDVASALNLSPEYSLADAVTSSANHDSMVLKTFLTLHETGLYVLTAPESPGAADGISGSDVDRVLAMLSAEFAFVVVDTAPGLSEHTLAALDRTTDPVLLTSMDVPGLRGLRKEVDALDELGMLSGSRRLLVNFADQRSGMSIADVEATIGTKVDAALPRSRSVPASVNVGIPLLQTGGNDKTTKLLRTFVRGLLAGSTVEAAKPLPRSKRAHRTTPLPRRAVRRWLTPVRSAS